MRIWVLSDLHTEFAPFVAPPVNADLLIAAGDIGVGLHGIEFLTTLAPLPVIYVAGNHEYYHHALPKLTLELRKHCAGTNVHFLENDAFDFRGIRFLGATLWTDFQLLGKDLKPPGGLHMEEGTYDNIRARELRPIN
jgi:hypothetical protein